MAEETVRQGRGSSFAGKVWRLLVGIKDGLVLVLLLAFFSLIFAALSVRPNPGVVREGALLLQLEGSVVEEVSPIDPFDVLMGGGALPTREYAARDLVAAIDAAAGDTRIKSVALDLTTFLGGGQVHLTEVGEALDRFRKTGKPVFAYAVAYTDDSVQLAAHASEVWVDPMGGAALRGPGGKRLYFGNLFQRFGVTAHVYRVGTYKSAVEPYMGDAMSPAARQNAEAIYSDLWQEWQADVSRARPQAKLTRAVQDMPGLIADNGGDLARATVAAGLADRIGTRVEWGERIAREAGAADWDETPGAFASTDYDPWLAQVDPAARGMSLTGTGRQIGVITVAGDIVDGQAGPGTAGADRIAALLDDALDDNLAALVVRIDSPGGTVTGSETIRRAILRHRANKTPVVVSMGNYAASGGYWVATPANRIFAEPATLTGSIGVFAVIPSFEDLLGSYGINADGVSTTPLSGQPDILGGFTPEIDALLQAGVESQYRRFVGLVAQSRGISAARADELGQGRVWSGGAARQLGLVDQFGDLDAAIAWAAQQAKLGDGEWHVRYLDSSTSGLPAMLAAILNPAAAASPHSAARGGDLVSLFARAEQDNAARAIAELTGIFAADGMQARCLECVVVQPTLPLRGTYGHSPAGVMELLARALRRD